MKSATLPSLSVESAFLAEAESVLSTGETLPEFVEAAVRAEVQRRRGLQAFIACATGHPETQP
jgi:hypothetical protein